MVYEGHALGTTRKHARQKGIGARNCKQESISPGNLGSSSGGTLESKAFPPAPFGGPSLAGFLNCRARKPGRLERSGGAWGGGCGMKQPQPCLRNKRKVS